MKTINFLNKVFKDDTQMVSIKKTEGKEHYEIELKSGGHYQLAPLFNRKGFLTCVTASGNQLNILVQHWEY